MATYEWETCPYCHKRIGNVRVGLASNTTIGPKLMACPNCGETLKTGLSEWAEKSSPQKLGYVLRIVWWCFGAVVFLGGGTFMILLLGEPAFLKISADQAAIYGSYLGGLVALLGVVRVLYVARGEVRGSLQRATLHE